MEKSFFPYLAAFAWTGALILLGTFLRARIKIFQTLLFPASLIGGLIGFALMRFDIIGIPTSNGWTTIPAGTFSMMTFHLFAFGFVGIGLLKNKKKEGKDNLEAARGALWMGWLFGMLFAVQALIGYGAFYVWQLITEGSFYVGNGYLLGAGFTQGPGQTQAYATIWQNTYKMADSVDVGLAFAALGFLVAGIVGVPFTQYGLRKGWASTSAEIPQDFRVGLLDRNNQPACAHATTHAANVDTVAFHMSIMCMVYGLAYCFGLAWQKYFPIEGVRGIGIGYMFIWGMMIAMVVRKVMDRTKIDYLLDPETTRRLTNTTVDFMICAVFLGIKPTALQQVIVPFTVSVVIASAVTVALCLWFGRRAPEHGFARAVTMFGYCTGTAASGLMLLRLVDPEFKTTVALEVGLMALVTFIVFKPISFSMPFAPSEGFPMMWIFLGVAIATPFIMYFTKLVKKPQF